MKQQKYDVVVVGSGIGGLCAGALLAHRRYKTLVVEQRKHTHLLTSSMSATRFHSRLDS